MKRYLLAGLALLWLALFWLAYFHPASYVPLVAKAHAGQPTIITQVTPQLQRAGVSPGMHLKLAAIPLSERYRLVYGAPRDAIVEVPLETQTGARLIRAPAQIQVPVNVGPIDWILIVCATFSLLLGAYLALRKPSAMIFALIMYLGGIVNVEALAGAYAHLPPAAYAFVNAATFTLLGFFPNAILASFAIRFPGTEPARTKKRAIQVVDGIVLAGFAIEAFREGFWKVIFNTPFYSRSYLIGSAVVVAAAAILSLRYAKREERGRIGLVFAAIVVAGLGYATSNALGASIPTPVYLAIEILSVIVIPVAVAYAILKHRIFDIAFVVNNTLVFAATSLVVLAIFGALELLTERFLSSLSHLQSAALDFGIALIVGMSARPVHRRADSVVDALIFRKRHEQESSLRRFAKTAEHYTAEEPLARDTVNALVRFGDVHGAALYRAEEKRLLCDASTFVNAPRQIVIDDCAYVEARAHQEPLDIRRTATAFPGVRIYPMVLADRVLGALTVGERESGEAMPPDIDDAIQKIAASVAACFTAIEVAHMREENAQLRLRLGAVTP